ncbi:hypothetical protein FKW31_02330 [Acetobacter sp. DmW_136]|uniref:hypothetical protein n=1 Tax=Acetobacter sp. DmW_136 TaxID=2591091 RepID=UPI00123C51D2|nr:hypothetical protein [Acetobacter sp. DmW_136]KAA8388015.1 hypothetical protein FKW31_02330 [Acetobacter sp. DmW_136]
MEKILENGNKLVLSENQRFGGSPKWGRRYGIYVAEIKPESYFYRRNGKNVIKIHSEKSAVKWMGSNSSPEYRYSISESERIFNSIH